MSFITYAVGATSGAASQAAVSSVSATSYQLTQADAGKWLRFTSATTVTITIDTAITAGTEIILEQAGAGSLSFSVGTSTVNSYLASLTTSAQYSVVLLKCVSANVFTLTGRTA